MATSARRRLVSVEAFPKPTKMCRIVVFEAFFFHGSWVILCYSNDFWGLGFDVLRFFKFDQETFTVQHTFCCPLQGEFAVLGVDI